MAVASTRIDINKENVCGCLGYSSSGETPARVLNLVEECAQEAQSLIEPSYSYVIKGVNHVRGSWSLIEGPLLFQSETLARLLRDCRKVGVLVVTIGKRLEERVRKLIGEGLTLQGAVMDAIGTDAVEQVARRVQGLIETAARSEGYEVSPRFSPGCADWDVVQQMMVFRAVERDSTQVRLTENCLMIPCKSLSGIVGIGRPDKKLNEYNPCKVCTKNDCLARR